MASHSYICDLVRKDDLSALKMVHPEVLTTVNDQHGRPLFELACDLERIEIISYFIQVMPYEYLEKKRFSCWRLSALMEAANVGNTDIVLMLLAKYPNMLGYLSRFGNSALNHAIINSPLKVVLLLDQKAPHLKGVKNIDGDTSMSDIRYSKCPLVKEFISQSDPPLFYAISRCLPEEVEFLLTQGANLNDVNEKGQTALQLVLNQGDDERCDKITQLILGASWWTPESHYLFPPAFRRGVPHVLGLMKAVNTQRHAEGKDYVRAEIWHRIIAHLPREWGV